MKQPSQMNKTRVLELIGFGANTVEEIHQRLGYDISLGTVYRACKMLKYEGRIQTMPQCGFPLA